MIVILFEYNINIIEKQEKIRQKIKIKIKENGKIIIINKKH